MRNRRLLLGQANNGNLIKIRVFKLVQLFQTSLQSLALSEKFAPIIRRTPSIVAQSDAPQKQLRLGQSMLPVATRVGFAGAVVIMIWWSWPAKSNLAGSTPIRTLIPDNVLSATKGLSSTNEAGPTPTTLSTKALSILNPAALPGAQKAEPTADAALPSIVTLPNNEANQAPAADNGEQQPVLESDQTDTGSTDPANMVLVPTSAPTDEPPVDSASLPQLKVLPAFGIEDDAPPTPLPATPTPGLLPTPSTPQLPIQPGRLWSTFTPPSANNDHFWVARPFAASIPNQLASPSYQFGSTAGNNYRIHHGVDIANVMGTPVLAAVDGEVVHAGPDDKTLLGPYNNFYGNSVVIRLNRRLVVAGAKLDVYLLFGHLSQVNVTVGQQVHPQDLVGAVGMTGIAIGPHLHVEMRLGANTYQHSINPYLWVQPLDGTGAVAVRVLTADGRTLPGAQLTLAHFENGIATWARLIETYRDAENIGPDPAWGENGAMDGVPAGDQVLVGVVNGESIRVNLTVRAGQTSFVEIRTKQ